MVIDCGHGGSDPGAIGFNAIAEKDITLKVGHALAHLLKKKRCKVSLTRKNDTFVLLDERTRIINVLQPDAYISIHANSAANKEVNGIETYCLHDNLFSVAPTKTVEHQSLFGRCIKAHYAHGHHLAQQVHQHTLNHVNQQFSLHDRKVKHAVTQLLLGTNYPGILVELGFITNPNEAQRLAQSDYQQQLAQGICNGLLSFLHL